MAVSVLSLLLVGVLSLPGEIPVGVGSVQVLRGMILGLGPNWLVPRSVGV